MAKLRAFDASENRNNFYGNPFLYHYQFENLLKCRREKGKTIYDIWADPEQQAKLIEQTKIKNRGGRTAAGNVYEAFRINTGSIVMFKATTAKYVYQKYGATSVLDPTAGWGGRMLGAWALGIDYTGVDTNTNMKIAYDNMMDMLDEYNNMGSLFEVENCNLRMYWQDSLTVDYSKIEYDHLLTSPPYINMELYEHMSPWKDKDDFYDNFLLPLWRVTLDNMKSGGFACWNISPKMYEEALAHGLPTADDEEDLKQQLGQQTGKKKQDKIYIYKS